MRSRFFSMLMTDMGAEEQRLVAGDAVPASLACASPQPRRSVGDDAVLVLEDAACGATRTTESRSPCETSWIRSAISAATS